MLKVTFKGIVLKLTAISAGIVLSLILTEIGLRVFKFNYTPLRIEVINNWSEWRYYHAFEDKNFEYDPILIWRPKKGGDFSNSQGYRGREVTPGQETHSFRIVAIGDSNTLGWSGKNGPNWPAYLEQMDGRLTVINGGVYGYSSLQGLRRFEESLAFHPHLAFISFGANDAMRVTMSDAHFLARKVRKNDLDRKLMEFRLGQLLLAVNDKYLTSQQESLTPRVSLPEYKQNLQEIVRIGRQNAVTVVLLTRPFTGESPSPTWWKNFAPEYNAATMEVGREMNVPTVNIFAEFAGRADDFIDEAHLTEAGHRRLAEVVYKEIRPSVDRWESSRKVAAKKSDRPD